jgi:hypothetical protein
MSMVYSTQTHTENLCSPSPSSVLYRRFFLYDSRIKWVIDSPLFSLCISKFLVWCFLSLSLSLSVNFLVEIDRQDRGRSTGQSLAINFLYFLINVNYRATNGKFPISIFRFQSQIPNHFIIWIRIQFTMFNVQCNVQFTINPQSSTICQQFSLCLCLRASHNPTQHQDKLLCIQCMCVWCVCAFA